VIKFRSIHTTTYPVAPENYLTEELLMKISKVLLSAAIIGVITVMSVSTVFAWHPKGVITKKVQNITTGGVLSEADTKSEAIAAKPGDKLNYVVEVRNDGASASNNYNDMVNTVLTDALPNGIALDGKPAQRTITENLGALKPGEKFTKTYTVVVTAQTEGEIENIACFTGNSAANDNHQEGCNPAFITVTVPPKPEEPVIQQPAPKTPIPTPQMPTELPKTGATENILGSAFALGLAWYITHRFINSRRDLAIAKQIR
jgi:uncharacterized repeat protein (TIGR01451 family)